MSIFIEIDKKKSYKRGFKPKKLSKEYLFKGEDVKVHLLPSFRERSTFDRHLHDPLKFPEIVSRK